VAASAAASGIGAAAASISSGISNGSNHGHGNNSGSGGISGNNGVLHQSSKAIGVSPLVDNTSNGNGSNCSGSSGNGSSGGGGMNMMTTQTIQNGFSRRKRASPLLTEDRLMSLLLLIVAVWFLYVRYEETKAFEDSGNSALLDKKGRPVAHYTPSDEYLAALNMEKKRDYDAHLQATAAAHNKKGGTGSDSAVFNNVRLYPDMGDDDSLIEQGFSSQYNHLRGNSLMGDDQTASMIRDTDLYTPSEIRLKMVSHGGLDKGGRGSSAGTSSTGDYRSRYYGGTSYNKKVQYRNGTGIKKAGSANQYPPATSFPEFEKDDKKIYRPAAVPTTTYQKETTTSSSTTYRGSGGARTGSGKATNVVPMTHHPATKATPVVHRDFDVDGNDEQGFTTTTNKTPYTVPKPASTYPKKREFTKTTTGTASTSTTTTKKTSSNGSGQPTQKAPVYVPKPADPTKNRREMVYPGDFYAREDASQIYGRASTTTAKHPYVPKRAGATTTTTTRGRQDPFLESTNDD
jgi:hypothetical protein